MSKRGRERWVIGLLAALTIALGFLREGEPRFADLDIWYDDAMRQWHVSGQVAVPRGGKLQVLSFEWDAATRTAPFELTMAGKKSSKPGVKSSFSSDMYEAKAVEAARAAPGVWHVNWLALAGGWLVCFVGYWVGWRLIQWVWSRRRRRMGD